jgi:peptide subunit release factor 1 (eRF1)
VLILLILGFIIAGSAGLKHDFIENIELSPSIRQKIITVLDVAQGSSEGLKQAIFQSREIILNKTLLREKDILN